MTHTGAKLRHAVDWLLRPPNLDREAALRASERLSAITHIVSAAEHLARPEYKEQGGPDDWEILGPRIPEKHKIRRFVGDVTAKPKITTALDAGQLVAGGVLLLPTKSRARLLANGFMAATNQLMRDRRQLGGDGSDHARTICNDMAFVARLGHRNSAIVDAALWGLGLQSTMSYTVSGAVKVMGPWWRQGIAIERIMRTRAFGHEGVYKLARTYPKTTKAFSHAVVAFECAAPLIYLTRGRAAKPYAIGAAAMHLGIGHTMALGRFIPSFAGMMCGSMYTSAPKSDHTHVVPKRTDLTPKYTAAGLAGGLGVMAASVLYDRRENRLPKREDRSFRTSDGSLLYYRRKARTRRADNAPTFFLENGIAGPREQYLQLGIDLAEIGDVITYHRAGVGPSQLGEEAGTSIEDIATRAVELLEHLERDPRQLIVVGHSRSCPFAMTIASQLGDDVAGVLLLDAPAIDECFESLDMMIRRLELQQRKMRWFLGVGMAPSTDLILPGDNNVLSKLGKADYRSLAVYLRDPATWEASIKEVRAIASSPNDLGEQLAQPSCPVIVVVSRSALKMTEGHESQLELLAHTNELLQLVVLEDEDRGDGFSVLSGVQNRLDLIALANGMALRHETCTTTLPNGEESHPLTASSASIQTDLDRQDIEV